MAYLIRNISTLIPGDHQLLFFDANAWIANLKKVSIDPHEQPYIDAFDAVINLNEQKDLKALRKIKFKPKIVLTSMLLSEIVNTYMRNIAMKNYYGANHGKNFKKDYRKETDYHQQMSLLVSDIKAFEDYIKLMDDDFIRIDPFNFLEDLKSNSNVDFNDCYYYNFLLHYKIPLITHDHDFVFENLEIYTANNKLLSI